MVEHGADLDAGEEDEKQVDAEDPAEARRVVAGQLVLGKVRLEDGRAVDQAVDGQHGAEGPEHHEPSLRATLGEG